MDVLAVEVDPVIKKKYEAQNGEIKNLQESQNHLTENMQVIIKSLADYQERTKTLESEAREREGQISELVMKTRALEVMIVEMKKGEQSL